jgi:hypothetical protein
MNKLRYWFFSFLVWLNSPWEQCPKMLVRYDTGARSLMLCCQRNRGHWGRCKHTTGDFPSGPHVRIVQFDD